MSSPQQDTIDGLFDRLAEAQTPGAVNQLSHALRLQISKKAQQGAALTMREQHLLAAKGGLVRSHRRSMPLGLILLLIIAGVVAVWFLTR